VRTEQGERLQYYHRQVVSALSGAPRAEILAQRKETSRRGTFDRGRLEGSGRFDSLWSYYRFPLQ
jgi:hypothetical protein